MILDTLTQYRRYISLSPRFATAFEFLKQLPADKANGRYEIDGDNCFALVQSYKTKTLAEAKFEAHQKYIDIQFIQAGRESILWSPLTALTQITEPYVAERDIIFYANPPKWTPIHLSAGQFTILFPEDGHAPGVETGSASEIRKTVIKVRL